MTSAIDGLISGLDTTSIIKNLMLLEAAPQTILKDKVTTSDKIVTALQALNAKLASMTESAKKGATPASWAAVTASSSAESVTATTTTGAKASTLTFSINHLALAQSSLSGKLTTATGAADLFGGTIPSTLTLATGTGSTAAVKQIDLTGVTDLAGLATAINEGDAGVTATLVKVSGTESRLQLTSKATGSAASFDLYSGAVALGDVATATAVLGRSGANNTVVTEGKDASITLWKDTGAEQEVTSASNTFAGVLTGLDFTLTTAETTPVTLTVKRNDSALSALASGLVSNLSTVLSEISSQTKSVTKTDDDGRTLITGGTLSGDSAVRALRQSVLTAATDPVNGFSPSSVGIVLGKDGTITFDSTIFAAALAADPDKVQAVITGLAARVESVGTTLSDKTTGVITTKITGQQSYVKSLGDQVLNWDDRLALRKATYEKQYAGLEVALGKLNSQSDWLTSQLDSMNANN